MFLEDMAEVLKEGQRLRHRIGHFGANVGPHGGVNA